LQKAIVAFLFSDQKEVIIVATKHFPRKRCAECKNKFYQKRPEMKFCGAKCRYKNWARNHPRVSLQMLNKKIQELAVNEA